MGIEALPPVRSDEPRDDGEIDVVDEAHLRDVLALCGALGSERVSLQQLPAASGSVTRDGGGGPG